MLETNVINSSGGHEVEGELQPRGTTVQLSGIGRPLQLQPIPLDGRQSIAIRPGGTRQCEVPDATFKVRLKGQRTSRREGKGRDKEPHLIQREKRGGIPSRGNTEWDNSLFLKERIDSKRFSILTLKVNAHKHPLKEVHNLSSPKCALNDISRRSIHTLCNGSQGVSTFVEMLHSGCQHPFINVLLRTMAWCPGKAKNLSSRLEPFNDFLQPSPPRSVG
jgi:hypothetical protein